MQDDRDNPTVTAQEWTEAIQSVIAFEGTCEADDILTRVVDVARRSGARLPFTANTAYINSIPPDQQPQHPGDRSIEHRIRSAIRWNALAIVLKANKPSSELGGHIASFQSAATLYDTGFMHFDSGVHPFPISGPD
jgi:pyruvate dehydrogenase E1 component